MIFVLSSVVNNLADTYHLKLMTVVTLGRKPEGIYCKVYA